jgi:hypothetical protein
MTKVFALIATQDVTCIRNSKKSLPAKNIRMLRPPLQFAHEFEIGKHFLHLLQLRYQLQGKHVRDPGAKKSKTSANLSALVSASIRTKILARITIGQIKKDVDSFFRAPLQTCHPQMVLLLFGR